MEKKTVKINGHLITQFNKNTYEAETPKQNLDFYFEASKPSEVQVVVFDSLITNTEKAYLGVFYSTNLKEAVSNAMQLTKDNVKKSVIWQ